MASIIPGYEYDIFISYRQKDNKYDGWVTEFIDHLKREIEATFKEDVSIYSDENPHDGLLEILALLTLIIFIPALIHKTKTEISASNLVRKAVAALPVSNFTGNPEPDYIV